MLEHRSDLGAVERVLREVIKGLYRELIQRLVQETLDAPGEGEVLDALAGRLITVRYSEPRAFQNFVTRPRFHSHSTVVSGEDILLGLLNAVINRMADVMEWIGMRTEEVSR